MTGKPANDAVPAAAKTRVESDHADSDTASTTAKAGAVTAAVGLAGLSDRLGTVHRADHATSAHKPSTAKDKVAKAKAGAKTSASTTHAISSHDHQPARAKLAKADAHNHPVAGKHTGKPLLTFALKDAKTAK